MRASFEPDLNVRVASDRQPLKLFSQIASTEEGMRIDESDAQSAKPRSSIDVSFEPDPNIAAERTLQQSKQHSPISSTDEGVEIDESQRHIVNAQIQETKVEKQARMSRLK
jgi:hypothetical protein